MWSSVFPTELTYGQTKIMNGRKVKGSWGWETETQWGEKRKRPFHTFSTPDLQILKSWTHLETSVLEYRTSKQLLLKCEFHKLLVECRERKIMELKAKDLLLVFTSACGKEWRELTGPWKAKSQEFEVLSEAPFTASLGRENQKYSYALH